ncbi:MAG TPA: DUF2934 domain-containing protein [Terriglobales bacterium]|nr:DUF2934 domain-containing protein [Terriglobales bacterium]
MAKAKSPRTTNSNKQVLTMPEAGSVSPNKRNSTAETSATNNARTTSSANNSATNNLEEKIRQRAYELYAERGYVAGYEHEDWLRAEREILARNHHQQSA